jgi:hypothetical protein
MNAILVIDSSDPNKESINFSGAISNAFLKPKPTFPNINSPIVAYNKIRIIAPPAFVSVLPHLLITSTAIATPTTPPAI